MPKPVIILGATPFSSLMRCYLEQDGQYEVAGYAVEKAYVKSAFFDDKPVFEFEQLTSGTDPKTYSLLNTIGYVQMNSARERIHHIAVKNGFELLTYVHPSAAVNSPLGTGCIVLENSSIGFRNKIGDGCIIWSNVSIPHDCKVGNFSYWSPGATSCGNVEIGDRCFIGANAVLKNRIRIAEECLIGAGAYIASSLDRPQSVCTAPRSDLRKISSRSVF